MITVETVGNVIYQGIEYVHGEVLEVEDSVGDWLVSVGSALLKKANPIMPRPKIAEDVEQESPATKEKK